jgi:hypothetical protein
LTVTTIAIDPLVVGVKDPIVHVTGLPALVAGQAAPVPLQVSRVVFAGTTSRITTPAATSFPVTL